MQRCQALPQLQTVLVHSGAQGERSEARWDDKQSQEKKTQHLQGQQSLSLLRSLPLPDKKFLSSQCPNKHVPKTLLNYATRSQPEKNKSYYSASLPSCVPPPLFLLLLL